MSLPLLAFLLAAALAPTPQDRPTLRLTLRRAIEIAVEDSARVRVAAEIAEQADGQVRQALAPLLPHVEAQFSYMNQTRNLEAVGFGSASFGAVGIPRLVGPFDVYDARASGSQTVLDLSALRQYQAAKSARGAARNEVDAAAEQAAAVVAAAYITALRADAELDAVEANVVLAEAVLQQAEDLKAAGTGTGMEITRSQVQLAHERQRRIVVQNAGRRARLQLLRALGLDLDVDVVFDDALDYRPVDPRILNGAMDAAALRPDYLAQLDREATFRLGASARALERAPSLSVFGDYGRIGTALDDTVVTRGYGVMVRIPIFDGGSRGARIAEAASQLTAEEIRTRDLAGRIAMEVRIALDSLQSADEEVQVAREGLQLAEAELEQSRRRYAAGVAPQLEVTEAQTQLARARDNLVTALFHHVQARLDLALATGALRDAGGPL